MPNRREFLRSAVITSSSLGIGGLVNRVDPELLRSPQSFAGREPGQEKTINGIRLCWCPSGLFVMGSPPDEPGHRTYESPVNVTLTKGFWIGKFEVTQGQWRRVVGPFPDRQPTTGFGLGTDIPAYWVSYIEAENFCAKATEGARQNDALPADWSFRLPTEAQWEYACRAGTTTATAFGDQLGRNNANFGVPVYRNGQDGPMIGRSVAVGSYPPNAWNIHDMHGNIFEWCRDWFHAQLPGGVDPDLSGVRGTPNRDGSYSRARRGGAWIEEGDVCRSASRLPYEPERRSDHIGFRVAIVEA